MGEDCYGWIVCRGGLRGEECYGWIVCRDGLRGEECYGWIVCRDELEGRGLLWLDSLKRWLEEERMSALVG